MDNHAITSFDRIKIPCSDSRRKKVKLTVSVDGRVSNRVDGVMLVETKNSLLTKNDSEQFLVYINVLINNLLSVVFTLEFSCIFYETKIVFIRINWKNNKIPS